MSIETDLAEHEVALWNIFNEEALRRMLLVAHTQSRFVHYTSAEVACNILTQAEVWMRRPQVMNDFQEIEWGWTCLIEAWNQGIGDRFKASLNDLFPGSAERIIGHFDSLLPMVRNQTFMTCISEHDDTEDEIGRLSMWRAYGGHAGVAMVLNSTAFTSVTDVFQAYTHPVAYHSQKEAAGRLNRVVEQIEASRDFLASQGEDLIHGYVYELLTSIILCTKHPGFREEREWRIIHNSHQNRSKHLRYFHAAVRGIPQQIVGIPLKDVPDEGLVGAAIPTLIDRVIIGPNEYAWEARAVIVQLLEQAGLNGAGSRVWVSDIPVRQQS